MPAAGQGQQVALGFFQGGQREDGGTGREIVDALFHVRFLLSMGGSDVRQNHFRSQCIEKPRRVQRGVDPTIELLAPARARLPACRCGKTTGDVAKIQVNRIQTAFRYSLSGTFAAIG